MQVQFFFIDNKLNIRDRTSLKLFITGLFKREKKQLGSLSYIFCSDEYLLNINRQFLQHDYYTDIITFDLSTGKGEPIEGEIYISIDRVRDNAQNFETTIRQELHRVIFHGALHLCGYQDKAAIQKVRMKQKEDEYLERYFK